MENESYSRKSAVEDIAFITRSDNRIDILTELDNSPSTPSELTDILEASRPTLGRVLSDFEDRGWIKRTDAGYVTTVEGEQMLAEFDPFIERIRTIRRLGSAVDWIPNDELSIGLEHFSDVTLRRPERTDPVEVLDFFTDRVKDAELFYCVTHLSVTDEKAKAMLEGVSSGRLDPVHVLTDELVDYLQRHSKRRKWMQAYLEAGADIFRYDETIPCNLFILDDLVILGESYPNTDHPYAGLTTEDESVRSWAFELIERYRTNAAQLEPEMFTDDSAVSHA